LLSLQGAIGYRQIAVLDLFIWLLPSRMMSNGTASIAENTVIDHTFSNWLVLFARRVSKFDR